MAIIENGVITRSPGRVKLTEKPLPPEVNMGDIILSLDLFLSEEIPQAGFFCPGGLEFDALKQALTKIPAIIQIDFPSFNDGRGFSLARKIRENYKGVLRAHGALLPDQYEFLCECGFDSVEIPEDIFNRQGEAIWQKKVDSQSSSASHIMDIRHMPRLRSALRSAKASKTA